MWSEAKYTVQGRVLDARTSRPLEGLHVRAYDSDMVWDDCLGCDDTDAQGNFCIPVYDAPHPEHDLHVVVYGPELHQLHFTEALRAVAGHPLMVDIELDTSRAYTPAVTAMATRIPARLAS